jgi:hypothetical protein
VFAGLRGQKPLILVDGAHHNESLADARVWEEVDEWLDRLLPPGGAINQP